MCFLRACKAGHGMDRSRKCGRLSKILPVKSNVTSPYQIRQNIVSRPFLLKDTNLTSRVSRKFSETSTRHMFQKWILSAGLSTCGLPTSLQLLDLTRHGEGYYCQKEIWSEIILPAYFLKEISSGVRQKRYSK